MGSLASNGLRGRVVTWLLERPFARFHRMHMALAQSPADYRRFIAEVVAPRLRTAPGRLGIFGTGEHTCLVLQAAPDLAQRVHCFMDNDPGLWRQVRFGRTVLPPREAVGECDAIFLSTAVFQQTLRADLRRLAFTGAVLAVDDVVPARWFLAPQGRIDA